MSMWKKIKNDALDNEYRFVGYSFTKEEVIELTESLVESGYVNRK